MIDKKAEFEDEAADENLTVTDEAEVEQNLEEKEGKKRSGGRRRRPRPAETVGATSSKTRVTERLTDCTFFTI